LVGGSNPSGRAILPKQRMATDSLSLFRHYAGILRDATLDYTAERPLPSVLRMAGDARHQVFYAPFDHLNPAAKLVLVGLSPGRFQALVALETARQALLTGADDTAAAAAAKNAASWSGPIRHHLVRMLDFIGIPRQLGIATSAELWTSRTDLIQFSAALRYPVFVGEKNFNGSGVERSPLLLEQVDAYFAADCARVAHGLFMPFGTTAQYACDRMVKQGVLHAGQIVAGLPHPSGANAERVAYFLGMKPRETLSTKTSAAPIDAAREAALRRIAAWRP
jgi:hypothetical protein